MLRAWALGAVAAGFCANSCFAQILDDPRGLPIPNHSAVDQNGVDLGSGRLDLRIPGPTIGSGDLELGGDAFYALEGGTDSWLKYFQIDGPFGNPAAHILSYSVILGSETAVFHLENGTLSRYAGDAGGTLSPSPAFDNYTSRDGTIYQFDGPYVSAVGWHMVGTIVRPDGETINLAYVLTNGVPNLISVSSNAGYMRHYENNVRTVLNRAIDYCDPTAVHCSFSRTWPSQTWASLNTYTVTVTDALNRQSTITRSSAVGVPASIAYPSGVTVSVTYGSGGGGPNDAAQGELPRIRTEVHRGATRGLWIHHARPTSYRFHATPLPELLLAFAQTKTARYLIHEALLGSFGKSR